MTRSERRPPVAGLSFPERVDPRNLVLGSEPVSGGRTYGPAGGRGDALSPCGESRRGVEAPAPHMFEEAPTPHCRDAYRYVAPSVGFRRVSPGIYPRATSGNQVAEPRQTPCHAPQPSCQRPTSSNPQPATRNPPRRLPFLTRSQILRLLRVNRIATGATHAPPRCLPPPSLSAYWACSPRPSPRPRRRPAMAST
jgi:hypothetical protein